MHFFLFISWFGISKLLGVVAHELYCDMLTKLWAKYICSTMYVQGFNSKAFSVIYFHFNDIVAVQDNICVLQV